jgi:diketogulonate reductase-like aldo/keto reductase
MESKRSIPQGTLVRRDMLKLGGLGAAAAIIGSGTVARAQSTPAPSDDLIMRTIPGSNEQVPAIGLGTFMSFDSLPDADTTHLHEVVRRYWEGGGKVFDTSALYGMGEINLGAALSDLDIGEDAFIGNKVWATGEYLWDDSHAAHSLARSLQRLDRPIDLIQIHSLVNVDPLVPLLRAWKAEGRVRYVGVTHHEPSYFTPLAEWIERDVVDFVQVHYSIHTRLAEERVLSSAEEHGVAVLVNMALEKGRLHDIVGDQPLPDFAAELGIETWTQFFLKWVIANPVVTCALVATSSPEHVEDNLGALRGPLPDEEMRARMVQHMETIPGFADLATMPWYPGKSYPGLISTAQASVLSRAGQ